LFLTRFASKVTIVHRRDEFRAQKIIQDRAFENPKIHIIWNSAVDLIEGDGMVESVKIRNLVNGEVTDYPTNGVFIYVGMDPITDFIKDLGVTNKAGYIPTDEQMKTSIPGIFAAGDVREKTLRQVVTATGDGSIAALAAQHHVENLEEEIKAMNLQTSQV
ncbi:NAD(P)/FAD-dependent oxidoreductase, partial [Ammoniphilus sp. 3BR4]|uniref:NAD(P)/FAD-dependent oxidoreductase n=1 Tax=Ammoniphilus sp. 3BR4 TaxID=3158265 RepID=UPI003466E5CB